METVNIFITQHLFIFTDFKTTTTLVYEVLVELRIHLLMSKINKKCDFCLHGRVYCLETVLIKKVFS